jgi:small GTP-binding protein
MTDVFHFKTVIIGDLSSGKSSFINRLVYNKFDSFINTTIGAQFMIKQIGVNNKLEMWDTAGQERYRSLIPMYLRNAVIVCIVISLEKNNESIENQKQYWLNYLQQNNTMTPYCKKILLYNKSDLNPNFVFQNDERFDLNCIISCKTNMGIDEFTDSIDTVLKNIKEDDLYKNMKIPITNEINLNRNKFIKCSLL